jgi:hypothetical protein
MITREDDVDAHALHRRGWTISAISAIARHLGHDRKTIRAYLHGGRGVGQRRRAEPDPFEPFAGYRRERLAEDPHLWATTLFDELLELGYDRSYPTFTRQLRARGLRPACEPCRPARGRHSSKAHIVLSMASGIKIATLLLTALFIIIAPDTGKLREAALGLTKDAFGKGGKD